ncbi:MAG: GntR family transcriptional regulator [Proteobacteria bacterium]|nr:GntR family transcriptional regulator [Pseudomonadota bacterium]MDA1022238.1 GntR family transcriptional regulator [Pseudomonadota bacterium]
MTQASLHDEIVSQIRNMIFAGEFVGGQRVPEKQLCEQLSVSRTPLREAIKVLASEGLLVLLPNRGARIAQITAENLDEIFPIMGALESLAGEIACSRITDDEIDEIRALHFQMTAHHKRRELNEYFKVNQAIHMKILEATNNKTLVTAYLSLAGRIRLARYRANFAQDRWDQAVAEHEKILDSLSKRDASALAQILRTHLENTCQTVKTALGKEAASEISSRAGK